MCGISGIISTNKEILTAEIEWLGNVQRHRGPDYTGVYHESNIALVHNRLSLLDLSESGNQPFKDEGHVLVYNGEIYNWRALRGELEIQGIKFKSNCDTEVLFKGIVFWGIHKTLSKLKGMFAFAWYDINECKCFLVRDRFGIKPLFYEKLHNRFSFASELKALSTGKGMSDLNMQFVAQSYYGVYETQPHSSPFQSIHQLEPGTILTLNTDTLDFEVSTWFSFAEWVDERQYRELDNMKSEDVQANFESLFMSSVESMSISDAPMGTFVSGGIDSSVIACAQKQFGELNLFTANVTGKYSEFRSAKLLADSLGLNLNSYDYLPENFSRDIDLCTWHYDGPISLFTNSVAFSGVAKLAREHGVKAVLTGEGADELFLGYPKLLTRKYEKLIKAPFSGIEKIYGLVPGLSDIVGLNKIDFQKEILQKHMNGFREDYKDHLVMQEFHFLRQNSEGYRCAELTVNQLHRHLVSLLWRNDRMGMMHSIESRFPFLDEALVKFALNLPHRYKIGRTKKFYNWKHPFQIDKAIVRRYAEKKLPKELVYKKKFGFSVTAHVSDNLAYDVDFFKGGFWQSACDMSNERLAFAVKNTPKKLLNKIASVEIWGKQFVNLK
jgi:asparagine synthase (glutamine-hydrolysing)